MSEVELAEQSAALARSHDTVPSSKRDLLRRTIAKGTTDDELELFIGVCNRTGLDPFARQIYAVSRWDKNERRNVWEADSMDTVRQVVEGGVGDSSRNEFFEVDPQHPGTSGLPSQSAATA